MSRSVASVAHDDAVSAPATSSSKVSAWVKAFKLFKQESQVRRWASKLSISGPDGEPVSNWSSWAGLRQPADRAISHLGLAAIWESVRQKKPALCSTRPHES